MRGFTLRSRSLFAATVLTLCALPLTACATGLGTPSAPAPQGLDHTTDSSGAESFSTVATEDSAAELGREQNKQAVAEQKIVSEGYLTIEVHDITASVAELREVTSSFGGHTEAQRLITDSSELAELTVRVPANNFDAAFDELAKLGTVTEDQRSALDVTSSYVDLEARIAALEASIARLTELMANAQTTADLLEAEHSLTERQAELDSLRAQLSALSDQVELSTIHVSLRTPTVLTAGGPNNFWDGLLSGLSSIVVVGSGLLVILGVALPWLLLLGGITVVIIWIVRSSIRASRRRRAQAQAQAQATAPAGASEAAGSSQQQPLQHEAAASNDESGSSA